jgi:hypothetical protein
VLGRVGVDTRLFVFADVDAPPSVTSDAGFHPSGLSPTIALGDAGDRALVTKAATGAHEIDLATGATTCACGARVGYEDFVAAGYAEGGLLLVGTTLAVRLYDRARDRMLGAVRVAGGVKDVLVEPGGRRALVVGGKGDVKARVVAIAANKLAEVATLPWVGAPYTDGRRILSRASGRVVALDVPVAAP